MKKIDIKNIVGLSGEAKYSNADLEYAKSQFEKFAKGTNQASIEYWREQIQTIRKNLQDQFVAKATSGAFDNFERNEDAISAYHADIDRILNGNIVTPKASTETLPPVAAQSVKSTQPVKPVQSVQPVQSTANKNYSGYRSDTSDNKQNYIIAGIIASTIILFILIQSN